jgi:hypothetical protein
MMHRETFIERLTEVQQIVENLTAEMALAERRDDMLASAPVFPARPVDFVESRVPKKN